MCTRIFVIFGIQLCKWILIIPMNYLLSYLSLTSLTWWGNADVNEITPCTCGIVTLLQIKTPEFIPRDVTTQLAGLESGGLRDLGVSFKRGLPFADPWCEGVERTAAKGLKTAGPVVQSSKRMCSCKWWTFWTQILNLWHSEVFCSSFRC